jgi:glutathione S-transferase
VLVVYGHPDSGHSYKARLYCVLAGVPHEYRYVDIAKPRDQRRPDFVRDAPYGEVPTIVDDGMVLAQSNAILMHLASKNASKNRGLQGAGATNDAFAGAPGEWPRVMQWLCWEMNRIGLSVPNLRYYRHLHRGAAPAAVTDWLEQRALADLAVLERELGGRDWALASGPTICDLSLSAYLHWADQAELDLARFPAVEAWLARIRALPGWQPAERLMAAPR